MDGETTRRKSGSQELMKLLKRHRLAQGLTMNQVASRLKVHVTTVGAWESGRNLPRAEMFPKLAKVLGIDALELTKIVEPDPLAVPGGHAN